MPLNGLPPTPPKGGLKSDLKCIGPPSGGVGGKISQNHREMRKIN
jgi:hypothetical protein